MKGLAFFRPEIPAFAGMTLLAHFGWRPAASASKLPHERRLGLHHDEQAARAGAGSAFCRRYNLIRLVHAEHYPTIDEAIRREKAIKEWRRAWKLRLITEANPMWDDLWEVIQG